MNEATASFFFELGVKCRQEGKHQEAILHFRRVVGLDPNDQAAWNNMANSHDDLGNFDEAIRCWRKAVDIKPDYAIAWHNMGHRLLVNARQNQADLPQAILCLEAAVAAKPDGQQSWALLGTAHHMTGNLDEAERCLVAAVQLNPGNGNAQNLLVLVRKRKRETEPTTGIRKGKIYSMDLNDGSTRLFKVLAVSRGVLEVLPINPSEPSRFAGDSINIRTNAIMSFFEDGVWGGYAEGGHLEHLLGSERW